MEGSAGGWKWTPESLSGEAQQFCHGRDPATQSSVARVSVGAGLGCLDKAEDPAQRTSQVIHPMEGSTTISDLLGCPVLPQASHFRHFLQS